MTEINWESFDCSVPWSDIPLSDVVDEGRYVLRVRELRVTGSREGKLMVMGLFSIEEGPLDGVSFPIQNFVLGTEDDPLCTQDPNTWKRSFGGRQLNQLLEACNVPRDERSLKGTLARASQARFQAYVTKSVQTTGDYAGTDQNRITRYAPYGQELRLPGQRPASNRRACPGRDDATGAAQPHASWQYARS
jgi:hypothetical protein